MQIFIQSVWRNTSIPYTNALDMSDNLFYFCNVLSVVKMWPSALQSVEISCLFPSWTSGSYRKVIVLRADCHNKDLRKLTTKFLWINIFQNSLFLPSRGLQTTFLCFLTLLRQFQKILIWIFFFSKLPSKSVLSRPSILPFFKGEICFSYTRFVVKMVFSRKSNASSINLFDKFWGQFKLHVWQQKTLDLR